MHDVCNHNVEKSAGKSLGNIGIFTVAGEWSVHRVTTLRTNYL